jgi:hypothetical protein
MKRLIAALGLVATIIYTMPTNAALWYDGYPTGPGGFSTPYPSNSPEVFAGFIKVNHNGFSTYDIFDNYNTRINVGDSWRSTLYSYDEVMAGTAQGVVFTKKQYSQMWALLYTAFIMYPQNLPLQDILGMFGNAGLAQINTYIWDIGANSCPAYWINCSSAANFNWSGMGYISAGREETLILTRGQNITIANTPIPPAVWLLGSGLLGLVGFARKRKQTLH